MNKNTEIIKMVDYIVITFESQKNGEKLQSILQHRSNRTLCPIKAWGSLVHTILLYENTDENTQVNYYQSNLGLRHIQASDMVVHLRATPQVQEFSKDLAEQMLSRVSLHSNVNHKRRNLARSRIANWISI